MNRTECIDYLQTLSDDRVRMLKMILNDIGKASTQMIPNNNEHTFIIDDKHMLEFYCKYVARDIKKADKIKIDSVHNTFNWLLSKFYCEIHVENVEHLNGKWIIKTNFPYHFIERTMYTM